MTTTKKTYVRPEIVEYEIQPCVPLATSDTKGQAESLKKDPNGGEVEWDN